MDLGSITNKLLLSYKKVKFDASRAWIKEAIAF